MDIYFDTEFTGLHKNTTLISIGCISEDGRTFYAEFDDYDKSQCNEWINENIIRHLIFGVPRPDEDKYYVATRHGDNPAGSDLYSSCSIEMQGNKNEIAKAFRGWLMQFDEVQFISDVCHYDFVLLIDLFGTAFDLPDNVSPVCIDINNSIADCLTISEREAFDISREKMLQDWEVAIPDGDKHNSLYDAMIIKELCNY